MKPREKTFEAFLDRYPRPWTRNEVGHMVDKAFAALGRDSVVFTWEGE